MDISGFREDYQKAELLETIVLNDPFQQFEKWFNEAIACKVYEPNAMHLATIDQENQPNGRIVLLKYFNETGFCFFTNYESQKGKDLAVKPIGSITFFWPELERQVRLRGSIVKVSEEASMQYFSERPRNSQLGAWASPQSKNIASRAVLEDNYKMYNEKFINAEIPKPDHWGGYLLVPEYFEFWQGRTSRLHDRIIFSKTNENNIWKIGRLAP
jgi:pyridoxamine 5'-phosphate oxidase